MSKKKQTEAQFDADEIREEQARKYGERWAGKTKKPKAKQEDYREPETPADEQFEWEPKPDAETAKTEKKKAQLQLPAPKVETVKTEKAKPEPYGKPLLALAEQFHIEMATAMRATWKAGALAVQMRASFPARAKAEDEGWVRFCLRVLHRSYKTVDQYINGYKYAERHEPARLKENPESLPPISLVSALASTLDERRPELHAKLFGVEKDGSFGGESASEFRESLRVCKAPETRPKAGPAGHKSKQTKRREKKDGLPDLRRLPREKIATAIPSEYVYLIQVPEYEGADELAETLQGIAIAHYPRSRKEWTVMLIPPDLAPKQEIAA